jgi:hypothetical protein
MTANPGHADQARTRTILRVVGFTMLAAGLVIGAKAGYGLLQEMTSPINVDDPSGAGTILMLGGAGFLVVFGLAFLNAGFLGATARYAAGETMPVMKDSAAYLTDGQGHGQGHPGGGGVEAQDAAGPFCTRCGVRNDGAARFCDACGHAIG